MNKRACISFLVLIVIAFMFMLTACKNKNITSYYLNDEGSLIAVNKRGKEKDLGQWNESIIQSLDKVEIGSNGYYIINGVKTDISAKVPQSYTVNENGHLVVTYQDRSIEDLGLLGNSLVNGVTNVEISNDGFYIINGIKTNIVATEVHEVTFETSYSENAPSQSIKDGYKVERPILSRTGYVLSGWYCNGEEWRFNSDVVRNDMTLTASWVAKEYPLFFVNEKGATPHTMVVTYDEDYSLPTVDAVDGYTFDGWYSGETKYSGGKWTTDADVTLTAKWTPKKYTVTLNPGEGSVSQTTHTVTYDQPYTFPVPTNSYGIFVGWMCDGEVITNDQGNLLVPWNYLENKTLTVDWEIKIYNYNDLVKLQLYPNAAFKLMEDIDLSGISWVPVGRLTGDSSNPFYGVFDGNNHKISNLFISPDMNLNAGIYTAYGLFGIVEGIIKNLTIENFSVSLSNINGTVCVGALAGFAGNYNVQNCKVSGSIAIFNHSSSSLVYAGGLIGLSLGDVSISDCVSGVSITNADYAGGFIGNVEGKLQCDKSINIGSISAKTVASGIAAKVKDANISNTINKGNITATDCASGIIGIASNGGSVKIYTSANKGDITTTATEDNMYYSGAGILGSQFDGTRMSDAEITDCYNSGAISSIKAAGIIGLFVEGKIRNCYNSGDIKGTYIACGIATQSTDNLDIVQCLAAGSVEKVGSGIGFTCSLVYSTIGMNTQDSYYTYNASNINGQTHGTYTNDYLGSHLYKDLMYWDEYNEFTSKGVWIFSDSEMPILYIETYLNSLIS